MKNYMKNILLRVLSIFVVIALGSNLVISVKAFAEEEDEAILIQQAIEASKNKDMSEFLSLRSWLCDLKKDENNKKTMQKVFTTIQDITNLNSIENTGIQGALDNINGYKHYKLIYDYYVETSKKISEDKKNALELLNKLKASKDKSNLEETKEALTKLPEGTYKKSLFDQFNEIDMKIQLDAAKISKSKEDLTKVLEVANRMSASERQKYLNIIRSLEKDKIDYANSRFRDYSKDKESATYSELENYIYEIVSPDAVSELRKKLESVKNSDDRKEAEGIKKEISDSMLKLNSKDYNSKRNVMNLINKLSISQRTTYVKKMEDLEKPLYDELVKKMKDAKTSSDKKILEETVDLYLNIVSQYYRSKFEDDYKIINKSLDELKYKESNKYIEILEKLEQFEEERNMKDKDALVKEINSILYDKTKKELLDRVNKVKDNNIKRLTLNKVGNVFFNNKELNKDVNFKIYDNNKVIDKLSINSNGIGITPKAYLQLKGGQNKLRVVAVNDNVVATAETNFSKTNLIPKLANELKPSSIKNSILASNTPSKLSVDMANILKSDRKDFSYIIVASAKSYADNLSVIQLASRLSAPILLLDESDITSTNNIKKYIEDNLSKIGKVIIIGGTGVVSREFENSLKVNKERLYGFDRYRTNKAILNKCDIEKGTPLIICSGNSFADALSISPISGGMDYPILLVNEELMRDDNSFIKKIEPSEIFIIGGTGVVTNKLEDSLSNYKVTRICGSDRYETSQKIREYFNTSCFKEKKDSLEVSGSDYVSGILGGMYGSYMQTPVILTKNEGKNMIKTSVK